jgi:hypothetical protein
MSLNSLARSAIQRSLPLKGQIDAVMKNLKTELADIGGASSPELKAAGVALAQGIRKTLGVKGALYQTSAFTRAGHKSKLRGIPSAPGQPPHKISGQLQKSVGVEVVGGVMRVGESRFTAPLLEGGIDAVATRARKAAQQLQTVRARRARAGADKRRSRLGLVGRTASRLHIAPRPFMQQAADAAAPKMGDAFVLSLQTR